MHRLTHTAGPRGRIGEHAPLVGRGEELQRLLGLLEAATIVTVTGPAGVGKTRLAVEAATQWSTHRHCAAVTVPLSGVHESTLVSDEIVAALPGPAGLAVSAAEALWERFGGTDVLLLLDDVEQLTGVGSVVTALREQYPGLHVLTTALRPLGERGEQVLRLRPLAVPDADVTTVVAAAGQPAVTLFAERAMAADTGFRLTDATVGAVADVCRAVGGLPLAIELAAARTSGVPLRLMAEQLAAAPGIDLLRGPRATSEGRHGSIRAALEWTIALLDGRTRDLLVRLSVFEGPFPLDAVADIATSRDDSVAGLVDRLSDLVDLALLDIAAPGTDDGDDAPARFAMPPLVRSFASTLLAGSGEQAEVRTRHARYFRDRCRTGAPIRHDEWSDVVVALDRATLAGEVDDALHAAVAAADSVRTAPGAARALQPRMADLLSRSATAEPDDPALRARAMLWSAMQPDRDVTDDAAGYAQWVATRIREALDAARRSGDRSALLEALALAVRAMPTSLDMPTALAAIPEGLDLSARAGDEVWLARFEIWSAMVARQQGDPVTASRLGTAGLRRARTAGDRETMVSGTLLLHGLPPTMVGPQLDAPLDSLPDLLAECERLRQPGLAAFVLAALAGSCLASGDLPGAAGWLARQLSVAAERQRTDPISTLAPIAMLVPVATGLGDPESAVRLAESIASMEPLLRVSMPPELFAPYEAVVAGLRQQVPADDYDRWARESSAMSLWQANRQALDIARTLVARTGPTDPTSTVQPDTGVVRERLIEPLTPRERDVLAALASGATNKQIAAALGMSPKTVMHHSVAVYRKTGVRGRAEATAWAFRNGYVPPTG